MRFRGVVALHGKTATGIAVPPDLLDGLGAGRRPRVRATINGYTYRSSVAPMGGAFLLPVSAEVRAAAGVAAGDVVQVELALDSEPRTVTVPDDLAAALDGDPVLRRAFDALSYSQQQRYVQSIEGARTPETRGRRLERTLGDLRAAARG